MPTLGAAQVLLQSVAISTAIAGFATESTSTAATGVAIWLYGSIMTQLLDRRRSVPYLFFLAMFAFFIFNGLVLARMMQTESPLYRFSTETQLHVLTTILASLVAVELGRRLVRQPSASAFSDRIIDTPRRKAARRAASFLFIITSPFALLIEVEKALYVGSTDYFSLYTSFSSSLPRIFQQASFLFGIVYVVLLAMRPTRGVVLGAAATYLAVNAVPFAAGQRNPFMLALLLTLFYLWVREREAPNKGLWLPRKAVAIGVITLPVLLLALQTIRYARLGQGTGFDSPLEAITSLLQEQAGTIAVIAYGHDYAEALDNFGPYLLSPIWNSISGNALINLFVNIPQYVPQTAEYATNARVFGQTLTYLVTPTSYTAGYGLGSSYLAEAYQDLGYLGVVLVSLMLGALIGLFGRAPGASSATLLIILLLAPRVWYAPRASAFDFVYDLITPTSVAAVGAVAIYAHLASKGRPAYQLPQTSFIRHSGRN